MAQKIVSQYCPNCQKQALAIKDTPSHILHLLLSVVTAGLWVPVWIFIILANSEKRPVCQTCGAKTLKYAPKTPKRNPTDIDKSEPLPF